MTLVVSLIGTAALLLGLPASAAGPVFPVMNTSETLPDGVWFRDNPNVSGPRLNGYGVYRGDRVELRCYGFGESLGPYANRLWYYAADLTRPSAPGRPNVGWLNAHYVDDKQNSNIPTPGVVPCDGGGGGGATPPPASDPLGGDGTRPIVQGCYDGVYWGKRTLTWSYAGGHRYLGNAYQAAANWNKASDDAGAALHLVYVPPNQKSDILFTDEWVYKNEPKDKIVWGDTPHDGGQWPFRITPTPPAPPLKLQAGTVTIKLFQKRLDDRGPIFDWYNRLSADQLNFRKTYTATHELGHALGLAHPAEQCGLTPSTSVMGPWSPTWGYNTPQDFDRKELRGLFPKGG